MALNDRHPETAICDKGGNSKRNRLATEDSREGTDTYFQAYSLFLAKLVPLKYLGRLLTAMYYNWLAVVASLQKSQNKWDRMSWILGQDCRDARTPIKFFKAFFQSILLFGSEMLVLTPESPKDKIAYVPLDPVSDYVYIYQT